MDRTVLCVMVLGLAVAAVGCPPAPVEPDGGSTTTTLAPSGVEGTTTTGLGEEADAVWGEVEAMWEETGGYRAYEVSEETLARARGRIAGLLVKLGTIERVAREAPAVVELLSIEFDERLDLPSEEAVCVAEDGMRTGGGRAYERLAERVETVDALALAGYENAWLSEHVLARMAEDARAVRAAMAEGDDWRTEDERARVAAPAEVEAVVGRVEAALARFGAEPAER
ncbi:MAG: hypothetical protein HY905_10190 [Deltaproteobacteria bacterium]|nr:hypothetical protein [Deltaproteobacteria bacterium]